MGRRVRIGKQEFELKTVILGQETGARFPCCGVGTRLESAAARQRVTCPECAFPWRVRKKGRGFDWAPDHSQMRRSALPGVSPKELVARALAEASWETRPAGKRRSGARDARGRRRNAGARP
jgi:hypothetical protein